MSPLSPYLLFGLFLVLLFWPDLTSSESPIVRGLLILAVGLLGPGVFLLCVPLFVGVWIVDWVLWNLGGSEK